ncbi:hypothetical protein [Streptomyces sp. NRRL B-24484]|uniref:hypothetical protein n=1 Tax=Streptomyces sp. NRRL B-24484 TaxID=1463833 RepID=UPI0004C1EF35|nr:hypothetical protein [Streptomyces sp. NRRL B-24484]
MRLRTLATAAALTGLTVLGTAQPAGAHGDTIAFTVSSLVDGHLTAVATWENDHDPVDEKIAGTLSATDRDGRAVGPWQLVAVAGKPGTYTTARQLPPGHWKVVVESGFPALGRGEAEIDVTAVPGTAPSSGPVAPVGTAPAPSAPAPSASAGPIRSTSAAAEADSAWTWMAVVVAVLAVTAAGGALLLRRRRAGH